jgi:hypothetical protein
MGLELEMTFFDVVCAVITGNAITYLAFRLGEFLGELRK